MNETEIMFTHAQIVKGGRASVAWAPDFTDKRSEHRAVWVHMGVAWCTPRDQFCRAKGRHISAGRLLKYKAGCLVLLTMRNDKEVVAEDTILRAVVENLDKFMPPEWVQELARSGMGRVFMPKPEPRAKRMFHVEPSVESTT